jgi:hypothetical protein
MGLTVDVDLGRSEKISLLDHTPAPARIVPSAQGRWGGSMVMITIAVRSRCRPANVGSSRNNFAVGPLPPSADETSQFAMIEKG